LVGALLRAVDAGVEATGGEELSVAALFDDATGVEYDDVVGVGERGQPSGAQHDRGALFGGCARPGVRAEGGHDVCFGGDVDGGERVVEYQQPGLGVRCGQGAGQGDALALPAGDPYSQFADLGLVTVGPAGEVVAQPGHPHRLFDAAGAAVHIGESDIGEGDVVAHGAGEDRMALREVPEKLAVGGGPVVRVAAVDEHMPGRHRVQAGDRVGQGGLAGGDWSGHREHRPRRHGQAHAAQRRLGRPRVAEVDAVEHDGGRSGIDQAGRWRRGWRCGDLAGAPRRPARTGCRWREQRGEAAVGGARGLDPVGHLRYPVRAGGEPQEQLQERDERPDTHRPGGDPLPAEPHDGYDT